MDILVVDDDPAVRRSLERALRLRGYAVRVASGGSEALAEFALRAPDAVVLDLMLPDIGGVEVCHRLRAAGDWTPVLILTARSSIDDRVAGLDAGADDYLVKPFALAELLARLRAMLRRQVGGDSEVLRFADLSLNLGTYTASRGDRSFHVTRTEFALLELFLRNPRQVLPRGLILERVWGFDDRSSSNSLEVYVGNLRRKTGAEGEPQLFHTLRGVGYVLREP